MVSGSRLSSSDEVDAIAAGNELARYLYTSFGRDTTNELVNGKRTLASLGIEAEEGLSGELRKVTGDLTRLRRLQTTHRLEAVR